MILRTTNVTCVARLFRLMAWRTTNVTCVARLFRVMAQRTTNVTCVARLFRLMAQRTTNVTCIARLFRVMAQRTTNVTCVARSFRVMALTTTFISYVALVLPHGFKNEVCFMCSTLFRLTAERYFLCLSRTDLRGVRSTLARTNCLYRARSSLFANIFNSPRCC